MLLCAAVMIVIYSLIIYLEYIYEMKSTVSFRIAPPSLKYKQRKYGNWQICVNSYC